MKISREPAVWMAVLSAALALFIGFGLKLTQEQVTLIMTLAAAITGLVVRQNVVSSQRLEDHNINPDTLKKIDPTAPSGTLVTDAKLPMAVLALALGGSVLFSSCALHGKSPQRQIATIGIEVLSGLDATGKAAHDLHASHVLTDQQYEAFLVKLKVVYQQAGRLADALKAYDAAASTDTASQVKAALDALAVLVPNVAADLGGPAAAKIAELVGNVNRLLLTIAAAMAPPPTASVIPNTCMPGGAAWALS